MNKNLSLRIYPENLLQTLLSWNEYRKPDF